jgi:hypothetical protein
MTSYSFVGPFDGFVRRWGKVQGFPWFVFVYGLVIPRKEENFCIQFFATLG